MGGSGYDSPEAIAVDPAGNVVTTGYFTETADFDPSTTSTNSLTSAGHHDIFVSKLDADGNFQYSKQVGGPDYEGGEAIVFDHAGNVFVAGYFRDSLDFDPSPLGFCSLNSGALADAFITKFDPSGNFEWAKALGGVGVVGSSALAVDDANHLYLGGWYDYGCDLDPDTLVTYYAPAAGTRDGFVSKFDNMGNFVWSKVFGGPYAESVVAIAVDQFQNVYSTGLFDWPCDFDPSSGIVQLTPVGDYDAFIHKLAYCDGSTASESATACNRYVWPLNGVIYESSGNFAATISNAFGCDSTVTLQLTLTLEAEIHQNGNLLNATSLADTYQWLNCDSAYLPIPGANGQDFLVHSNGNYCVVLTLNGCIDTSACVNVSLVGLQETEIQDLNLFPNPAHDFLHLASTSPITEIALLDLSGRLLAVQCSGGTHKEDIDISQLAEGLYWVRIKLRNQRNPLVIRKFIKR